jgi:hypothetical protein
MILIILLLVFVVLQQAYLHIEMRIAKHRARMQAKLARPKPHPKQRVHPI